MDFKLKVVRCDIENVPPYEDKPVAGAEVILGAVGSGVTDEDGEVTIPAGTLTKIAAPIIIKAGKETHRRIEEVVADQELVLAI